MKILLLYTDRKPVAIEQLQCFSDVWGYYLGNELAKHVSVTTAVVSTRGSNEELSNWFDALDVSGYDAILALGLRYFSGIPKEIVAKLRERMWPGFVCQIYDGSRLDTDGVDITFNIKNDNSDPKYQFGATANRFVRHCAFNEYIGWAADPDLNYPNQPSNVLRFLVDHTNYGNNQVDKTDHVLDQIRSFYASNAWASKWNGLSARRFDSGKVTAVDMHNASPVERYDRTGLPYPQVCKEHSRAHVFFVTHPESVGQVVLETATAGALVVAPTGFIPADRLETVRHIEYTDSIPWREVLASIDVDASRNKAISNSWEQVAKRIRDAIAIRKIIRTK